MFKELAPVLRDRAVLLTVTLLDEDRIRVNLVPKKLRDGDNDALTIPLSVTGTAEELDAELSSTIIGFVGSHLQMKNTLEKAKSGMDAASKAAQAEALSKSKTNAKAATSKTETTQPATSTKSPEPEKPAPVKAAGLFDPPLAPPAVAAQSDSDEDDEPSLENDEDDAPVAETEELDDAAWRLLDVLSPRLQTASGRHKTILGHSDSRTSGFGWRTGMFSSTVNPVPGNTLLSSDAVGKHRPAFRY